MSETLRLFIALQPDEGVQQQAGKEFNRLNLSSGLRSVNTQQLHITLKFWSHFPLEDLAELLAVLKEVAGRHSMINLRFNSPVIFGGQQARVLALATESSPELQDLYNDLEETLAEFGLADREGRVFQPHLTLARVRDFFSIEDRQRFEQWRPDIPAIGEELKLFVSELTPHGPEHDQMAVFSLQSNEE
ncbi:MAG: RNA 2',3'-cyclic phosphodiesterase [Candidatus Komeilibacteria bacterium]